MIANQIFQDIDKNMVVIKGGQIEQRDDGKKISWRTSISKFLISKFQVTQKQFIAIMGYNNSTFVDLRRPVENVSWLEAVKFCNQLSKAVGLPPCYEIYEWGARIIVTSNGYRLPTDAEWEYSCCAGTIAPIYGKLPQIAWYKGNSNSQTHEVGQLQPNEWGLHDMLGNVWEWCFDIYDAQKYGEYRIFRGGGWNDSERGCLATNRRRSHPTFRIDDLGFRIARTMF